MKKLLIGFILLAIGAMGISADANAPSRIVGLVGECDTTLSGCSPIPLTMTLLCGTSCPLRSSFSYTNSLRFWGTKDNSPGACLTSTDGGLTWVACTAQAFVAGGGESYAGAGDGSVIAVGNTGGPDCTIRRSTNNATSWTTVFADGNACQTGGQPGQHLYCLSNGNCEHVTNQGGIARIYRSSDNGASWVAGTTGIGGNCTTVGAQWDGLIGIMPSENTGCGGGNVARVWVASGDTWTDSIVWNGTQGDCWTPVIYNSVGRVICTNGTTGLRMYEASAVLVSTMTLPGVTDAIDSQGPAIAFGSNTLYIAGQVGGGVNVFVSRDNLASFTSIGSWAGGGAGARGGNAFTANGCVYMTTGLTPLFGKIC